MSDVIICITQSLWEGPKRIRHHLMKEYARRGCEVYFVEAYLTLPKLIKNPKTIKSVIKNLLRIRTVEPNINLIQVPPFLPGGEWLKIINDLNWSIAKWWVKIILNPILRNRNKKLFVFAPYAYKMVGAFSELCSIYICNDPFTSIFKYKNAHKNLDRMESILTKKVDLVFAVSDSLADEKKKDNENSFVIDHAVDYDVFSKALLEETKIPDDVKDLKKPVIGHIGPLNHRIDTVLLASLFEKLKNYTFLFVGPIIEVNRSQKEQIENLSKYDNVVFLGHRDDSVLPNYLKSIDVCIIPYVHNEASKHFKMPAKFYQFVAAGKPVISTVGSLKVDDDILMVAHDEAEMIKMIESALSKNSNAFVDKRTEYVMNNTFSARVDEIEKRIENYKRNNS